MKKNIFYIFLLLFISSALNAQTFRDIMNKHQVISIEDRHNKKDIQSITMELEITTPKGLIPARLMVMEDIGYRLDLLSKSNHSAEIINQFGFYKLGEMGKIEKEVPLHSIEYMAKKSFLKTNLLESYTRNDFPQDRIEMMGIVDLNSKPYHAYKIRGDNTESYSELFFDIEKLELSQKNIIYTNSDGVLVTEEYSYGKYITDKETMTYASEFSTNFGSAKVKSIKINSDLNPNFFDAKSVFNTK